MSKASKRRSSSRAKPLQATLPSLSKLFNVTAPTTGGRILGGGLRGFIAGIASLVISLAISLVALVLISLAYTQIESVSSETTTIAVAALSLGTVALGLQVIGAIPAVARTGPLISLITMIAYIVAGVLALLVVTQVPANTTIQTYALIAGIFYVFIGGAYL